MDAFLVDALVFKTGERRKSLVGSIPMHSRQSALAHLNPSAVSPSPDAGGLQKLPAAPGTSLGLFRTSSSILGGIGVR